MSGEFYYEFMYDKKLGEDKVRNFIKYLKKHQSDLIQIDNFTFDVNSLSSKIMLSKCLDCEKYNNKGNCCYGNPYAMPPKNREALSSIVNEVVKVIPEEQSKDLIPVLESGSLYTRSGSITTKGNPDGRCFFSYKSGDCGYSKCAIHAYCLENGLNPAEYKPYTCSCFPLFGVRTPSDNVIIMCACKDTYSFAPYIYTLTNFLCVNESNLERLETQGQSTSYLKSVNADKVFEDNLRGYYREAYIEQENVLRFFVGDSNYELFLGKVGRIRENQ